MKTLYAVTEAQFGQIQKINAFFTEKERELRAKMRETQERCEKLLGFFVTNVEGHIIYDDRFGNVSFFRDREDGKFAKQETVAFLVQSETDTKNIGRKVELALCTTALQFGERYDESDILDFDEGRVSLNITLVLSSAPQKSCRKPVFEDIPLLDSFIIERIFERIETEELAKAIFSAPLVVKNKFYCNLCEKEVESLKKAVAALENVPENEVEKAREKLTAIMGELAEYAALSLFPNLNYEEKSGE